MIKNHPNEKGIILDSLLVFLKENIAIKTNKVSVKKDIINGTLKTLVAFGIAL